VHDPREIALLEYVFPRDVAGFQAEGNQHFSAKPPQLQEAVVSYSHALKMRDDGAKGTLPGILSSVLLNIAALHLQHKDVERGLLCAYAAVTVAPRYVKAYYRCALALQGLKQPEAALQCCRTALQLGQGDSDSASSSCADIAKATAAGARCSSKDVQDMQALQRALTQQSSNCSTVQRSLSAILGLATAELPTPSACEVQESSSSSSSSSVYDADAAAALKAQGNVHFQKGELSAALQKYSAALAQMRPAAVLLCNRCVMALWLCTQQYVTLLRTYSKCAVSMTRAAAVQVVVIAVAADAFATMLYT
jgi:tetratricopeptide (TPR) repeat protein